MEEYQFFSPMNCFEKASSRDNMEIEHGLFFTHRAITGKNYNSGVIQLNSTPEKQK
jgi:hypothetical protein